MTLGLFAYKSLTGLIDPALPLLLKRRIRSGKEDADRIEERRGYASRKRPPGPLVWMHGASIGESQVLLLLFEALKAERPDLQGLITTQTQTSAELIARKALPDLVHQMAPADTVFSAKRFLDHWRPDLAVFAEGDLWPNLISKLDQRRIPRMLINARMTQKSLEGWMRFKAVAKKIFTGFDPILTANQRTYDGLRVLAGRKVKYAGNIKYAAPPLPADETDLHNFQEGIGDRPVLAALSTHPGEEEMVLKAWETARETHPDLLLILAPRHPERGDDIAKLLEGQSVYRRSIESLPTPQANIWLCDTLGELGLWIRLSSLVYLGGGQPGSGIFGHNPIEPLKLGKYVVSMPEVGNFQKEFDDLTAARGASFIHDETALARLVSDFLSGDNAPQPDRTRLNTYLSGDAPLLMARDAVLAKLPARHAE
ncbi:MAG: 3-deoxy-D-manno-octulosonic acid transferase [Ponticaulis sp.]|nr:3-deoxy-D-manno-octulosonic acid transferase [Ponticaulis sp.]|tara:strand:- start:3422 stop:4699 length:1278 start_codon:yes stop_codon:yes gene_type:complete